MEVKRRILEEASLLFAKNGIRAVTMSDIASEAGISKRTLYEHFENKDELLAGAIILHKEKSDQIVAELREEAKNPIDFMHRHFRLAVMMIQNTHPGLMSDLKRFHAKVYKEVVVPQQLEGLEYGASILQEGIEQGYFDPGLNVDMASKFLHAQIDLMYDAELFPPDRYTRVDLFQHIIVVFLRGIATEKGRKEIELLFN